MANIDPPLVFSFKLIEFVIALVIIILLDIHVSSIDYCMAGGGQAMGYLLVTFILLICFVFLEPLKRTQNIMFCSFGVVVYLLSAGFLGYCYDKTWGGEAKDLILSACVLCVVNAILMLIESILGCLKKDGNAD